MKRKEDKYTKLVITKLKLSEYEKFQESYKQSACPGKSSYARKLLLGQPITLFCRDQSVDELTNAVMGAKRIMEELLEKPVRNEADQKELIRKMDEIKETMIKFSDHVCKIEFRQKRHKGNPL